MSQNNGQKVQFQPYENCLFLSKQISYFISTSIWLLFWANTQLNAVFYNGGFLYLFICVFIYYFFYLIIFQHDKGAALP